MGIEGCGGVVQGDEPVEDIEDRQGPSGTEAPAKGSRPGQGHPRKQFSWRRHDRVTRHLRSSNQEHDGAQARRMFCPQARTCRPPARRPHPIAVRHQIVQTGPCRHHVTGGPELRSVRRRRGFRGFRDKAQQMIRMRCAESGGADHEEAGDPAVLMFRGGHGASDVARWRMMQHQPELAGSALQFHLVTAFQPQRHAHSCGQQWGLAQNKTDQQ